MNYVKKLKFADILRNKKINQEIILAVRNSFKINKSLFNKKIKKFKIIICDTEAEFKKETKKDYRKWITGITVKHKKIIIKSPDLMEKVGIWKRKDFNKIMTHEINHVFWYGICKAWKPDWMLEGFACYVANMFMFNKPELRRIIEKNKVNVKILDYRYMKRNFKKGHFPKYPVWGNFIKFIIEKYSVKHIIRFLDNYSKKTIKSHYIKLFPQIFGKSHKELFNEFLQSINQKNY